MVIVNDRTPVDRHDPQIILSQLQELTDRCKPDCILLDFQRPGQEQTAQITRTLCENLPCPVGVSESYAKDLDCPVFLPPPPLYQSLKEYLKPWNGRKIWLEIALDRQTITVTESGSQFQSMQITALAEPNFADKELHCAYHIECNKDAAIFTLQRDRSQLDSLLEEAKKIGVELAVGLNQQLRTIST